MEWLDQLVSSGRIADIAMLFIVGEVLLIAFALRRPAQLRRLVLTLLSGFCLIGAVSAALTDAGTLSVAAWLVAAMFAHVADMGSRLLVHDKTGR